MVLVIVGGHFVPFLLLVRGEVRIRRFEHRLKNPPTGIDEPVVHLQQRQIGLL